MIERKRLGEIEIETGYEAIYIGTEKIIRGEAEIWHMPERNMGKVILPPEDVVKVKTTMPDGSIYEVSTSREDPRLKILTDST